MSDMRAQILANRFAALAVEGADSFARMARSPTDTIKFLTLEELTRLFVATRATCTHSRR